MRDDLFPNGLLLSPTRAMAWDDAPTIEALTLAALGDLLNGDPRPEFLLLGTGAGLRQPPRAFVRDLEAKGIGVEAMDSRAAAQRVDTCLENSSTCRSLIDLLRP